MPTASIGRLGKKAQVKRRIVRWIGDQGLKHGEQILGQNELASLLETSPVTVHKALTEIGRASCRERV